MIPNNYREQQLHNILKKETKDKCDCELFHRVIITHVTKETENKRDLESFHKATITYKKGNKNKHDFKSFHKAKTTHIKIEQETNVILNHFTTQ